MAQSCLVAITAAELPIRALPIDAIAVAIGAFPALGAAPCTIAALVLAGLTNANESVVGVVRLAVCGAAEQSISTLLTRHYLLDVEFRSRQGWG